MSVSPIRRTRAGATTNAPPLRTWRGCRWNNLYSNEEWYRPISVEATFVRVVETGSLRAVSRQLSGGRLHFHLFLRFPETPASV